MGRREGGGLAGCDSLAFALHSLEGTFVPLHFRFCIYCFSLLYFLRYSALLHFFHPALPCPTNNLTKSRAVKKTRENAKKRPEENIKTSEKLKNIPEETTSTKTTRAYVLQVARARAVLFMVFLSVPGAVTRAMVAKSVRLSKVDGECR